MRTSLSRCSARGLLNRLLPALIVFLMVGGTQQAGSAQGQGQGHPRHVKARDVLVPGNEFLLHATPDRIAQIAARHGLTVIRALGPDNDVFLVRTGRISNQRIRAGAQRGSAARALLQEVEDDSEVLHFELNSLAISPEVTDDFHLDGSPVSILDALADTSVVDFFGVQVWGQYLIQPAATAIHLPENRGVASGNGVIVAIIDTGIDPNHPLLQNVLVPGYDFTRDTAGSGSEWPDLDPGLVAILNGSPVSILDHVPVEVNQSTLVIMSQAAATALGSTQLPAAFGHGTMVAGLVHLIAPEAKIMPLKAFSADGTSTTFDIVRAIEYATAHGARVINMSFSTYTWSPEVTHAINEATSQGVICVSSAGNSGLESIVYPAGQRNVIGTGSTNSATAPVRSTFSNYGDGMVSLGAPGEAVITLYPGGGYAGAWGTSFSSPMVAGAAALLAQIDPTADAIKAASLLERADPMAPAGMGRGRLNLSTSLHAVADETSPTVTFVAPTSGGASGSVLIAASASDNVGVSGVKFLLDDVQLSAEDTSAPYELTWNTVEAANGSHILTAVARDAAGNQMNTSVSVTVSNDVDAPSVAITSPGAASLAGSVTVAATASDDTAVLDVQFLVDGAPLGAADAVAPYETTWDAAAVANGVHVITAVARDAAGHTATSAAVNVTVANDLAAPSVALTSPGEGSVTGGVAVAATASDDIGVVDVQFLLDGAPIGSADATVPYQITWDSVAAANGVHVITAIAHDAAGHATTSAPVSVTVLNDTAAPIIEVMNPGAGTVSGGLTMSATASDDVGVVQVQFLLDGVPLGPADDSAPYQVVWDTSESTNGTHVLTAIANDAAGHSTTSAPVSVVVINDQAPPSVTLTGPGNGPLSGTVSVTASASDDIGVVSVEFLLDGVLLGTADTAAPYEVAWDTTGSANGGHVLVAVAHDAAGNEQTSPAVAVTVSNSPAP